MTRFGETGQAGRDAKALAREFRPAAQPIRSWVSAADKREGRRLDGADAKTSAERAELLLLRHKNKKLRLERDTLSRRPAIQLPR